MKKSAIACLTGMILIMTFNQCTRHTPKYVQGAEYHRAMTILMHEPTEELFPGVIHPHAALFSDYFNIDLAAKEHENYRKELKTFGAEVLTVREVLLKGTIDKDGNPIEGQELTNLRALAADFLIYNTKGLSKEQAKEQEAYKASVINEMNPKDLVRIILLQPEVTLVPTKANTGLTASYTTRPLMNLFYMRDQMISTAKGIVIGRMHTPQRETECRIVEFCLDKIGITPIGKISDDKAYLEGGDFLPFGNSAFIGCGLRTTQEAINQLMDNDWLGCDSLIVVKDKWLQQEQMHLDTYFNVIDRDLATLSAARYNADPSDSQYLTVDVYVREKNSYRKVAESESLVSYLENKLNVKVITVSRPDELKYANNYLTVGPRKIMAVAGQSAELQKALHDNGVQVTWIPLDNLTRGYGAAHCMTQILDREEVF